MVRPHTSARRPALILEHTRSHQNTVVPEWENAYYQTPIFPKKKPSMAFEVGSDEGLEIVELEWLADEVIAARGQGGLAVVWARHR